MMISIPLRDLWWTWEPMSDLRTENEKVIATGTPIAGVCQGKLDANLKDLQGFCWGKVDLGIALIVFMSTMGIAMVVIFALVGMDPAEKQARDVTFQAMKRKEEERRRKKKGERKKTYKR
jgi:hypothetical protein